MKSDLAWTSLVPTLLYERLITQKPLKAGALEQQQALVARLGIVSVGALSPLAALDEIEKSSVMSAVLNTLYSGLISLLTDAGALLDDLSMEGLTAVFLLDSQAQAGRIHEALVGIEKSVQELADKMTPGYPDWQWNLSVGVGIGTLAFTVFQVSALERSVFLMGGPALDQANAALALAGRGQIVAHRDVLKRMGSAPAGKWIKTQFFLPDESFTSSMVAQMLGISGAASDEEAVPVSLSLVQEHELGTFISPSFRPNGAGFAPLSQGLYSEHLHYLSLKIAGLSLFSETGLERWRTVLDKVLVTVSRYQGVVHQVLSLGNVAEIKVVFGLIDEPENIERRVVNCALALQRALKPVEPTLRLAISRSKGFAGFVGNDDYRGLMVLAEAVQHVKTLIERAEPREIVVSHPIQESTSKLFTWKPLANDAGAVLAGEVTLGSGLMTRVQISKRTPLIEREDELLRLKEIVKNCQAGETQIVIISGKNGNGRSALIDALIDQWLLTGGTGFLAVGPSYTPTTPYELWFPIWQTVFELMPEADPEENLHTLEAVFSRLLPELARGADLFADLLGLAKTTSDEVASLSPKVRQRRLFEANRALFEQLAEVSPVLLAFEHLDFSDSLSLELIQNLSQHLEDVPLLLCLEDRGSPEHSLQKLFPEAIVIEAKALSGEGAWRLLDHFLPEVEWPYSHKTALNERLALGDKAQRPEISKAGASPAFVVALATSLRQSVLKRQSSGWRFDEKYPPQDWPLDTIETTELLLESVLTQNEAQIALQASVSGLLFFHQAPWLRIQNSPLDPTLEVGRMRSLQLTEPYIDLGHGRRWDRFRHNEIREALYLHLNSTTKLALHEQVANWYRDHQPGKAGMAAVGYHLQHAGQLLAAVEAYLEAATYAAFWGAEAEALQDWLAAERLLMPQNSPEAQQAMARLCLSRAQLRLHDDPARALVDVRMALAIAEQLDAPDLLAEAFLLQAKAYQADGDYDASQKYADQAMQLAQKNNVSEVVAQALWVQARALAAKQEYRPAARLLAKAIHTEAVHDSTMQVEMGLDASGILLADYSRDRAYEHLYAAYQRAEKLGDPVLLHQVMARMGHLNVLYGEASKALDTLEKALTLPPPVDSGLSALGDILSDHAIALCYLGQYADAEATFDTALGYYLAEDDQQNVVRVKVVRAFELLLDLDRLEEVQTALDEARSQSDLLTPDLEALIALSQVSLYGRQSRYEEAHQLLQTLTDAPDSPLKHWYAPLRYIREAELALAENNLEAALRFASLSLGAVSLQGDMRFLTLAYCLLAESLILLNDKPEAIQDALERAVKTGHSQGRRLHLARAFYLLGQYLRQTALLYSSKARGSTYLFEADLSFKEMNIVGDKQISKHLATYWAEHEKTHSKPKRPR